MGQAFYRKYRSKNLAEIEGQHHITKTLERAIEKGAISHAYLFTGPRGVGKTSVARILAHQINGLSYTDESSHLDIIEIDAASNRRIDEIRDLRDKVHIAPTSAKYKVYIIDEVHMLTREAFNALLKTLEEPPAHVVFILATTEIHKLPETIISRTQRFTFKPIEVETAVKHLQSISRSENIEIDEEALILLAEHGQGSFRDSISLLDQVGQSAGKVTADDVRALIGLASSVHIQELLNSVLSGNPEAVIKNLNSCIADGVSPAQISKQLSALVRETIISKQPDEGLIRLLSDLIDVTSSAEPLAALEVALFRAQINLGFKNSAAEPIAVSAKAEASMTPALVEKPESIIKTETVSPVEEEPVAADNIQEVKGDVADWWGDVLKHIKSVNNTLYGVLRMAEPRVDEDTLHLSFGFGFHKKKASDSETQSKIHEAINKVTGNTYRINAVHDKNLTKSSLPEAETTGAIQESSPTVKESIPQNDDLASITNIFGGAEVLES